MRLNLMNHIIYFLNIKKFRILIHSSNRIKPYTGNRPILSTQFHYLRFCIIQIMLKIFHITESVRLRNLFIVGTSRIIHHIWQKVGMMPIYTHRIINKQAQSGFPASDSQLFYKVTLGRIIHTIVIRQILQESLSFQKIIRQLSNLIILFRKRLSV